MSFGSSKVRFTPRLLPRGGGAWSGDRWAAGRGPRVRAAAVPWRSACCVLLGHHHSPGRARPGPAGRSLSSRVRTGGRISGPRPCHFTEEEVATPDHAILGSQAFAVGAGAPLGRVDLEPLLSAGDDMLRVELGTCVKGVACSRPGMKRMDRPLCVCRQTGRLKDMGGEQQHPGQSSQCVCARPRVEKAPLKTAEGSRVEALEPFSQVR